MLAEGGAVNALGAICPKCADYVPQSIAILMECDINGPPEVFVPPQVPNVPTGPDNSFYLYKNFQCDVRGKGTCETSELKEIRQMFGQATEGGKEAKLNWRCPDLKYPVGEISCRRQGNGKTTLALGFF